MVRRCPGYEKMLVVSTGHISETENALLSRAPRQMRFGRVPWRVIAHEYGFIIAITSEEPYESAFPNVSKLIKYAHKCGMQWLNIDRDGEYLLGFPTYKW